MSTGVNNPESIAMDSACQSAPIVEHILTEFVLCATPAAAADDRAVVTGAKLTALPLFFFVLPTTETLPKMRPL
jgi:hypothetical protein